jgi:hypothetical protein
MRRRPIETALWILVVVVAVAIAFVLIKQRASIRETQANVVRLEQALAEKSAKFDVDKAEATRLSEEGRDLQKTIRQDLAQARAEGAQWQAAREALLRQATKSAALTAALSGAQGLKVAAVEYFQTEGKWPASNEAMGLPAPTGYALRNVKSVGIEAVGDGAQIRVRFLDDANKPKQVLLVAETNAAMQVAWKCVSPDITDIATLTPACSFSGSSAK